MKGSERPNIYVVQEGTKSFGLESVHAVVRIAAPCPNENWEVFFRYWYYVVRRIAAIVQNVRGQVPEVT